MILNIGSGRGLGVERYFLKVAGLAYIRNGLVSIVNSLNVNAFVNKKIKNYEKTYVNQESK